MIPDYCSECINRQNQTANMPYMQPMMQQPMMQGGYQSTMQMPLSQQPMQQPQFQTQPMQQMGYQQTTPGQAGLSPLDMAAEDSTSVETNINYTQGYLRTKIGARVKIEFLIGTNMLVDREGTLTQVGISYVIIREIDTDDDLLCDIYSIKFVRFYY
ncbi:MAG: hypothetical protein K0R09_3027 [Clostridiales bacterium]|jgi:hypothetical protein|nr:hypothetical protein [Clostridiales bacterium]